jgi:hypothetical protein
MRRWSATVEALPDGAMVEMGGAAHLVWGGRLRAWAPAGYGVAADPPQGPL